MYCKSCGAELRDEAKFCPSCGMNLNSGTANEVIVSGNGNPVISEDVTGKEFEIHWNGYYYFFFYRRTDNSRTIKLEKNHLTIIKPNLTNNPKILKTIDYANIKSVECIKKPHIKIRAIVFSVLSVIIGAIIATGDIDFITLVFAILFVFVFPCYICSTHKPVNVLIKEQNGKKTKLLAQKDYTETADELVRCINLMTGR